MSVNVQAVIQKYETFAGRSAMLGFVACVLGEIADAPVVRCDDPAVVVASALVALTAGERRGHSSSILNSITWQLRPSSCGHLCAATILALTRQRLAGGLLLEAVVASLTSTQRSASSLTATPGSASSAFDAAVDRVVEQAFDVRKLELTVQETGIRTSSLSA